LQFYGAAQDAIRAQADADAAAAKAAAPKPVNATAAIQAAAANLQQGGQPPPDEDALKLQAELAARLGKIKMISPHPHPLFPFIFLVWGVLRDSANWNFSFKNVSGLLIHSPGSRRTTANSSFLKGQWNDLKARREQEEQERRAKALKEHEDAVEKARAATQHAANQRAAQPRPNPLRMNVFPAPPPPGQGGPQAVINALANAAQQPLPPAVQRPAAVAQQPALRLSQPAPRPPPPQIGNESVKMTFVVTHKAGCFGYGRQVQNHYPLKDLSPTLAMLDIKTELSKKCKIMPHKLKIYGLGREVRDDELIGFYADKQKIMRAEEMP
jgi:hypothetical protein